MTRDGGRRWAPARWALGLFGALAVMLVVGGIYVGLRASRHPGSVPAATATPTPSKSEVCHTTVTAITGSVADGRPLATNPALVIPRDLSPVAGATVRVLTLGLETMTDARGGFEFKGIEVTGRYLLVDVEISAPGFGTWRIERAPLRTSGLILFAQLESRPITSTGGAPRCCPDEFRVPPCEAYAGVDP